MTEVTATFELDIDAIADGVCDTTTFSSAVESAIDDYDFSYTMESQISDALDNSNFIDRYDISDYISQAIRDDSDVRTTIRDIANDTPIVQPQIEKASLEALVLCHKILGSLSQQFAVVNSLMGVSAWPNNTGEALRELGTILESLGHTF